MVEATCQRKRHNGTLKLAKCWTVLSPSRQKEETGLNLANFGRLEKEYEWTEFKCENLCYFSENLELI